MFTMLNPFASQRPAQVSIKAPWSNRSKILAGAFVAGCVGSTASVFHDLKVAAEDMIIPETAVDRMLDEGNPTTPAATDGVTATL